MLGHGRGNGAETAQLSIGVPTTKPANSRRTRKEVLAMSYGQGPSFTWLFYVQHVSSTRRALPMCSSAFYRLLPRLPHKLMFG